MMNMTMYNREDSIERLSEKLDESQLRKVITQGYSDISLSLMAKLKPEFAKQLVDNKYSPETMNKLTDALAHNKIDEDDFWHIVDHSQHSGFNEKYVDDFLSSIDNGIYHRCAANLLVVVQYEDISYNEGLAYVKSGAFYPTEDACLTVTDDIAKELFDMGVKLRGCEGFNHYYDVEDISASLEGHDAVFVGDKNLALKVNEFMKQPDWEQFKEYAVKVLGSEIQTVRGNRLDQIRTNYITDRNRRLLFDKVQQEFERFKEDLRTKHADEIIDSAYEIVSKGEIVSYCECYTPGLSERQYNALLSSCNTLDEVYEEWRDNSELHSLYDIGLALEETADKIQYAIEREVHEQIKQPDKQEVKLENKPKNRSM